MKYYFFSLLLVFHFSFTFGQGTSDSQNQVYFQQAQSFGTTPELRDILPLQSAEDKVKRTIRNKLRRNKHVNPHSLPLGPDPVWQNSNGTYPRSAPLTNWEGINSNSQWSTPPDPSGAVGVNHYVEMVNTAFQIWDKQGNSLSGPSDLNTIVGNSNDGDPIVMYDRYADRWFLSQFQMSGNQIVIAISQTPDPLGAYFTYSFSFSSFPDYPKFSIWHDGYYMTANMNSQNAVAFERDKMIAGDPTAQMVALNLPNLQSNGFTSPLPAFVDGPTLPPVGTPQYFVYFYDDGWGAGGVDHVKFWEMNVDWSSPGNSSISLSSTVNVTAFDSEFTSWWDDIEQPGTSQKLDAIPGAMMYRAQYRTWGAYNTFVMCHAVDVDATNHAGVRWYEMRDANDGNWTLYQEGTYAPDADSRWLGSISMDNQGNIALAYTVSGSSTYPSIRYTGRNNGDPLGQMTISEENIIDGVSSQSGTNRWGDYAEMTVDPVDDQTFWYVGEYMMSGGWSTRIASWKFATEYDNDVGVVSIDAPVSGTPGAAETVSITVKNHGLMDQTSFDVGYSINGGAAVTETYSGSVLSGATDTYSFTATGDFSNPGFYTIKSWTNLSGDQDNNNDTLSVTILHSFNDDVGVTAFISPVSGTGLGLENVQVTITNFGTQPAANFPVSYSVNGTNTVTATYTATINGGSFANYIFSTPVDLSALGTYDLVAYTAMTVDSDNSNDTLSTSLENTLCEPIADCGYGDGFEQFELNTLLNASGCDDNGYGDYINLSTDLEIGTAYDVTITSGYGDQFFSMWIDFNDNFQFETTELMIQNFGYGAGQQAGTIVGNTTLTIPSGSTLGQHIMRIRNNWQADSDDPCSNFQYGETEDYSVNIIDSNNVNVENIESIEKGVFNVVSFEEGKYEMVFENLSGDYHVDVYNSLGQKLLTQNISISNYSNIEYLNLKEFAKGSYLLKVYNGKEKYMKKVLR